MEFSLNFNFPIKTCCKYKPSSETTFKFLKPSSPIFFYNFFILYLRSKNWVYHLGLFFKTSTLPPINLLSIWFHLFLLLSNNSFTFKNSVDFVEKLRRIKLQGCTMFSFDVNCYLLIIFLKRLGIVLEDIYRDFIFLTMELRNLLTSLLFVWIKTHSFSMINYSAWLKVWPWSIL